MPSIYEKSTKELFEEFIRIFTPPPPTSFGLDKRKSLSEGCFFTRKEILKWFQKNYEKIKQGTVNAHLIVMSTNAPSRVHHKHRPNGADDLLFQMDKSRFRLYNKNSDPAPIFREELEEDISDDAEVENDSTEGHEFAYEKDLKNFLANNLNIIQSQLSLYQDGINLKGDLR